MLKTYSTSSTVMRWKEPKSITLPRSGISINVSVLSLKSADGTCILGDNENPELLWNHWNVLPIVSSPLCEGWDGGQFNGYSAHTLEQVVTAHKTLFALIYRFPISFHGFMKRLNIRDSNHWSLVDQVHRAMSEIGLVCGYAEYYGALEIIAPRISDMLFRHSRFWKAVAHSPQGYLVLGSKLHSSKLYFDALRHMIARAPKDQYAGLVAILRMTREEAEEWVTPLHFELEKTTHSLERQLFKLQLSESWATYGGDDFKPLTTFINMLEFKHPDRSNGIKAQEDAALFARIIYGQWLAQQVCRGDEVFQSTKIRHSIAGSFSWAVTMLRRAHAWENPSNLFEQGTVEAYVERFCSGAAGRFNPQKQIEAELKRLICAAVTLIDRAFKVREGTRHNPDLTYRATESVDKYAAVYPYFPLNETDVPWVDEVPWPKRPDITIPLDLSPPSEKFLQALGMTTTNTDD